MRWFGLIGPIAMIWAGMAAAQGRTMLLAVDQRLLDSGLVDYLVPRFALKHGIRPEVVAAGADALDAVGADAVLGPGEGAPAFRDADGATFALSLAEGAEGADAAAVFGDWLLGEVGQRTVTTFDGAVSYLPAEAAAAPVPVPPPAGDADAGATLAHFHCGRCHVVSAANRMGGIGSSPSFAAIRAGGDWEEKFAAFWTANPHPSFMQVAGMTEPFRRPPHIAPVLLTLEEAEAIIAYAATIAAKDLGAPVQSR